MFQLRLDKHRKDKGDVDSPVSPKSIWKIKKLLGWAPVLSTSRLNAEKVKLHRLRLKMVLNLSLILLRHPRQFIGSLDRGSIYSFLRQFIQIHPTALENKVRKKLGSVCRYEADYLYDYFQMLAMKKEKWRVLVIDRFMPAYDKNSSGLRMYSILNVLNDLGCRVTFIPDNLDRQEPYVSELNARGIDTISGDIDVESYLIKSGPRFDIVILSEALAAYNFISLVRAYAVNAKVIYDTVDLHWVRLTRAAAITGDPQVMAEAEYFKRIEHFLIDCSDIIFTVTQTEKDYLLQHNSELDVHVVPNVHNAIKDDPAPFSKRKDLMFIGHYYHQPNVDAIRYFVYEVFPLLQQRLGQIKFYIVGSNPTDEVLNLQSDDVIVTGYVPDVTPYFESARVFVAPLRFGAGMKGKIGQSMTYGLPVVTTSIGAEGMGLKHGKHVLVADNTHDFINSVERLYSDEELWWMLSSESKNYIHKTYSTSAMRSILLNIIEHIEKQKPVCYR